MNARIWSIVALVVALLADPPFAGVAGVSAQGRPALAGTWVLSEDTDVPEAGSRREGDEELPGRDAGGRRPGGVSGPGGLGLPGAMGSGRPDENEMRRVRDAMRQAREASRRLTITRDGEAYAITDAEGRTERFTANGKKEKRLTNAGFVETRASWEGAVLVVETEPGGGMKLKRRYTLLAAPDQLPQLEIRLELRGGRIARPIEVIRVYDLAAE